MKKKTFAQTLLSWRKKHKLTRVEACRMFNVPYRTWQDWEAETHTPGMIVQEAIKARILAHVPHGAGAKQSLKRLAKK